MSCDKEVASFPSGLKSCINIANGSVMVGIPPDWSCHPWNFQKDSRIVPVSSRRLTGEDQEEVERKLMNFPAASRKPRIDETRPIALMGSMTCAVLPSHQEALELHDSLDLQYIYINSRLYDGTCERNLG